jgi:hypothetical protein
MTPALEMANTLLLSPSGSRLPAWMDQVRPSSSPVLSRSTIEAALAAASETVPVSSSVSVGAMLVTATVIVSSELVAPSVTRTVRL